MQLEKHRATLLGRAKGISVNQAEKTALQSQMSQMEKQASGFNSGCFTWNLPCSI